MELEGFTGSQTEVIRELSFALTTKLAPDETDLFDICFSEYLAVMPKSDGGFEGPVESSLSFDAAALQDLLTPPLITAVVIGLSKVLELLAEKRKQRDGEAGQRSGIPSERPNDDGTSSVQDTPSLDSLDFDRIERALFDLLRSWRIGEERARSIAREFIVQIVQDPSRVYRFMK